MMPSTFSKITFVSFLLLMISACSDNTTDQAANQNAAPSSDPEVAVQTIEEKAPMGKLPDDPLEQMRITLKPFWLPFGNGGIIMVADAKEPAMNSLAFQRLLKLYPEIEPKDNTAWEPLAEKLAERCLALTREAKIEYGVYELKNYHKTYAEDGTLYFDSKGGAPIGLPDAEVLAFTFTEEHEKLIRHMNVRADEGSVWLMHFTQPYVGHHDMYRAMAMALGDTIPEDVEIPMENKHYYDILQREMIFAAQAFWLHAQMPDGK